MNDPNSPVTGLRELELDASPEFLRLVRNKIDRRRTSGQMVSFGWDVPRTLMREFFGLLSQLPALLGSSEGKQNGNQR